MILIKQRFHLRLPKTAKSSQVFLTKEMVFDWKVCVFAYSGIEPNVRLFLGVLYFYSRGVFVERGIQRGVRTYA